MLSIEMLRRLWPRATEELRAGMVAAAPAVFAKYGLDTPDVVAIFMAQISHECGEGRELVENLNYSPEGIVRTWPKRFASVAAAMPFAHHPQLLANKVYNGRMGNRPGSNDGWSFRGRGGTNCTGHDGYYKLALKMAVDLLSNPDLVNQPDMFLECAVVDFILCGCLPYAKKGDFRMVTMRLNGGLIGLSQRQAQLKRWQVALAEQHGADKVMPPAPTRPPGALLRLGDSGYRVKALQQRLAELGYACGSDDGEFHEATRDAVNAFKAVHDLPVDNAGTVDQATEDALEHEPIAKPVGEARAIATAADLRDAGSQTVAGADRLGFVGRAMKWCGLGGAAAGGAQQVGIVDLGSVQDGVDKAQQAYGILQSVKGFAAPLLAHPQGLAVMVAIAAAGVLIVWEAERIIARRLADHQSGANMGR